MQGRLSALAMDYEAEHRRRPLHHPFELYCTVQ
jgi:hypothetical protein